MWPSTSHAAEILPPLQPQKPQPRIPRVDLVLAGLTVLFQIVRNFVFPALICRAFLRRTVLDSTFCRNLAIRVGYYELA